ncbi:ASCH domain-containing protein [Planococcus soli]|uniref:ASCH domain-containing protein n=1 Tax=Planococcus soli TaxID=2666072 RepID=UPI00115DE923|nr:ASCH domain-containing protein [Planococcus soli]
MKHEMGLYSEYFELIKAGKKKVEVRLNDEKRRNIKVGEIIKFSKLPERNEVIQVEVTRLTVYSHFQSMYEHISFTDLGCAGWKMEAMIKETYDVYSQEQEKEYGALAIRIKLLH